MLATKYHDHHEFWKAVWNWKEQKSLGTFQTEEEVAWPSWEIALLPVRLPYFPATPSSGKTVNVNVREINSWIVTFSGVKTQRKIEIYL